MNYRRVDPQVRFILTETVAAGWGWYIGAITEDEWQTRVSLLLKIKARL